MKCFLTPERSLQEVTHTAQHHMPMRPWFSLKMIHIFGAPQDEETGEEQDALLPQRFSYDLSLSDKGLFVWQIQRIRVIQVLIPEGTETAHQQLKTLKSDFIQ